MKDDSGADRPVYHDLLVRDPSGQSLIGLRIGTYRIESALGAGGMGLVFRAYDERLQRAVAIKLLTDTLDDDEARARLLREARLASRLNHPNICTIHEVADADGVAFIVFECIDGKTLDALIPPGGLPIDSVIAYGRQIADALTHAHAQGVIHRDLKSANVMVTAGGRVKVLDFGLARRTDDAQIAEVSRRETALESVGAIAGTLPYMAPETLRGETADARTDLWALGVVLYELAAGARPFTGRTPFELSSAILLESAPPLPARVPAGLRAIILRCLLKERGQRYQHAGEIRAALETLESSASAPVPETTTPRLSGASFRHRWLIVAGAALVLAVAGTAILRSRRTQPPRTTAAQLASVVALPAKVLGAPEYQYLTDAVPATLSTQLVKIEGLDTKEPPNSLETQQLGGDLTKIAAAYGASACVVSTITADGDRLVLNVQLVQPRDRRVLWSDDYTGSRQNYLALVRQAADGLRGALRPQSARVQAGNAEPGPTGSDAELELRRGQYYSNRYGNLQRPDDFAAAFASLTRALNLDPNLAEAAAEISRLYLASLDSGAPRAKTLAEADIWARKAINLNPRSGLAWAFLAYVPHFETPPNIRKAVEYALRAAASDPRCSRCQFALRLSNIPTLSVAVALEAHRLDPLFLVPYSAAAGNLFYLGRSEEALRYLDDELRVEADMPFALAFRTRVLIDLGRLDEADQLLERVQTHVAEKRWDDYWSISLSHELEWERANPAIADGEIARLQNGARASALEDAAEMYTLRHRKINLAASLFAREVKENGPLPYDELRLNPRFEPFVNDLRFRELLTQSRAQFDDTIAIFEDAHGRGELPKYLEQPLADLLVKLGMQKK